MTTQSPFAVLSPYLIPPALATNKAVNIGDGFILRGIERLLGAFGDNRVLSPRITPDASSMAMMADARGIVLAGANQLHDGYTIWPGLTVQQARSSGFRFIPFAIGLHGVAGRNEGMSAKTREILDLVHERTAFSSWRCPLTVRYLRRELPHLADRFLMTGCPVAYDRPILESARVHGDEATIALTVTDREDFWEREIAMLDAVARLYPHARRLLVLHQDFVALGTKWAAQHPEDRSPQALRRLAVARGFELAVPRTVDEALALYRDVDLHIGSRLHAHLHFLSQNKRSVLVAVDDRATGMAEAYGFDLCTPASLERGLEFDFEMVRTRVQDTFEVMRRFTASLDAA